MRTREGDDMTDYKHQPILRGPGDRVIERILREIAVREDVLAEAKRRRNLVCELARAHPAARAIWYSGSIAHGTHNAPLGDADCGVMVDRTSAEFRAFGPDAEGIGRGPEPFIQGFSDFILPRLREAGYPSADVDLGGNRSIKFVCNDPVDFDDLREVDPYVDLIVGLDRRDAPGIWIPNRKKNGWDSSHPQMHTKLMTKGDPESLIVHRAHQIRLGKRAIKRDDVRPGHVQVMCPWNLSALALELVRERGPLAGALAEYLAGCAGEISRRLTPDPAGVSDPIKLPDDVDQEQAAARLAEMSRIVAKASEARSELEAERLLGELFGVEIESIRVKRQQRERNAALRDGLKGGDHAKVGAAIGSATPLKRMRSDGAAT